MFELHLVSHLRALLFILGLVDRLLLGSTLHIDLDSTNFILHSLRCRVAALLCHSGTLILNLSPVLGLGAILARLAVGGPALLGGHSLVLNFALFSIARGRGRRSGKRSKGKEGKNKELERAKMYI